ncbi:MAG: ABC transporter permease [Thermoleophilia bacterium]
MGLLQEIQGLCGQTMAVSERFKMRLSKAWIVASKDFKIFRKKRSIVFSLVSFEILISVVLPLVIAFSNARKGISASVLPGLINSFSYWFVIGSAILPMSLSTYSLIGEKVQKSLEPLLATPTTDEEILVGKNISAGLPAIASTYIGGVIFMTLIDIFTHSKLTYLFYPNWNIAVILLLLSPLATIFCIGANILISSRSNDVRAAQQFGCRGRHRLLSCQGDIPEGRNTDEMEVRRPSVENTDIPLL